MKIDCSDRGKALPVWLLRCRYVAIAAAVAFARPGHLSADTPARLLRSGDDLVWSIQAGQGLLDGQSQIQCHVDDDGTIDLGRYGKVTVAGLTISEAKVALENHVASRSKPPGSMPDPVSDMPAPPLVVANFKPAGPSLNTVAMHQLQSGVTMSQPQVRMVPAGRSAYDPVISAIGASPEPADVRPAGIDRMISEQAKQQKSAVRSTNHLRLPQTTGAERHANHAGDHLMFTESAASRSAAASPYHAMGAAPVWQASYISPDPFPSGVADSSCRADSGPLDARLPSLPPSPPLHNENLPLPPHEFQPISPPAPIGSHPDVPQEQAKVALPPYVIEPPDVLLIESTQSLRDQPIRGQHLVRPDGTVGLGIYGSVPVAGLTLEQGRQAIAGLIAMRVKDFDIRNLYVDVLAYNSKVYYVITDGGGYGEQVYRFPITGSETVLDAISQINGLPPVASKRVWVARPVQGDAAHPQCLPVNWVAVTQCGNTATNYQVLPGDRIYVQADRWITFDSAVSKVVAPFERMFGVTLLGSETVNSIRFPRASAAGGVP